MQKLFSRSLRLLGKTHSFSKFKPKGLMNPCVLSEELFESHENFANMINQPTYFFSMQFNNFNSFDNNDGQGPLNKYRPQTVPLKAMKNIADEPPGEEIRKFVLFTSKNPLFPNTEIKATVHVGNLNLKRFDQEFLYVVSSESNPEEIYTVGIILNDEVNHQLEENMKTEDNKFLRVMISPKRRHYRVKITEIEMTSNGDFVKGYVLKDDEPSEEERLMNLKSQVAELRHICHSIRSQMQENVFNIDFDAYERGELTVEHLDDLLFNIVNSIWHVNTLAKDGFPEFFQTFLEATSVVVRLFLLKNKLNEMLRVAMMIAKSLKYAEDSLKRRNDVTKAQLSIQYLENTFLWNYPRLQQHSQQQQQQQQQAAESQMNPTAQKIKSFRDNLHLIKDESSQEKVRKEIDRVAAMDKNASEYTKIMTYLDEVFSIPWEKYSEERWDVEYTRKVLEEGLFGLEKVKERIVELVASNKLRDLNEKNPKKGIVICLFGPPGTGKTSIAKHLAKSLNREMRMISFAGVTDLHYIKGHRRTYIDSQPGVFVRELIKAKTMNPVFVLDEIDKMGRYGQGADPYYSLLEILNPEESQNFTDHYMDIKVDFSRTIFILTANEMLHMLEPLRNRLEIIEVPAYIDQEKLEISKHYLMPKVLESHGLLPNSIQIDDETIMKIIKGWCYYESGVRELKRSFEKIARKFAHDLVDSLYTANPEFPIPAEDLSHTKPEVTWADNKAKDWWPESLVKVPENYVNIAGDLAEENVKKDIPAKIDDSNNDMKLQSVQTIPPNLKALSTENVLRARSLNRLIFSHNEKDIDMKLRNYLGLPLFDEVYERISRKPHIGVANVLTVNGFAGHVLSVEVIYDITQPDKKNNYTVTGNLKQVLQESLSVAKINALKMLPKDLQEKALSNNYHIHFLQGSTPKDGPSAGLSVCTALLSRILDKPIPSNLAMTGELSLNGDVYKIGGLQHKLIAAKALDIKTILIPHGNKSEFMELPFALREGLTVYFVKTYQEVYNVVFSEDPQLIEKVDCFVGTKSLSKSEQKYLELFTL